MGADENAWGPLSAVTVLDLTRLLPGGYCTLLLADLGANVIKVEEPGRGDYIRSAPPVVDGESAAHQALNRGKRSVTLNLKSKAGAALLRQLAGRSDILMESFRPEVMARLGLGYDGLAAENRALIYCAITGYGQDGPYRDLPGHDINYIGYGGLLSMTGAAGGGPVLPGVQVADLAGGTLAAIGILAALVDRAASGRGRFVDASMLDGVASMLSIHAGAFLATGRIPERGSGVLSGGLACYRVYRASDGRYLTVGAVEPRFWRALCEALECADLVEEQYAPPDRQAEMAERLQAIFERRTRDEWIESLRGVGACVGPVLDVGEALGDPQVRHRGMVAEIAGREVGPGPAIKMSDLEPRSLRPAPRLGEHNAEVLKMIGVGPGELAKLEAEGVV